MGTYVSSSCWQCGEPCTIPVKGAETCSSCGRWLTGTGDPPQLYVIEDKNGVFGGTMWEEPEEHVKIEGVRYYLVAKVDVPKMVTRVMRTFVNDKKEWEALLDELYALGWKAGGTSRTKPGGKHGQTVDLRRVGDIEYKRNLLRSAFNAGFRARNPSKETRKPEKESAPRPDIKISKWRKAKAFGVRPPVMTTHLDTNGGACALELTPRHAIFALASGSDAHALLQVDVKTGEWFVDAEGVRPAGLSSVDGERVSWAVRALDASGEVKKGDAVERVVWDAKTKKWLAEDDSPQPRYVPRADYDLAVFDLTENRVRNFDAIAPLASAEARYVGLFTEAEDFVVVDITTGDTVGRVEWKSTDARPKAFAVVDGKVLWYGGGILHIGQEPITTLTARDATNWTEESAAAFSAGGTRFGILTDKGLRLFDLGPAGKIRKAWVIDITPLRSLVSFEKATVKFRGKAPPGERDAGVAFTERFPSLLHYAAWGSRYAEWGSRNRYFEKRPCEFVIKPSVEELREAIPKRLEIGADTALEEAKAKPRPFMLALPMIAFPDAAFESLTSEYKIRGGTGSWDAPYRIVVDDVEVFIGSDSPHWSVASCANKKALAKVERHVAPFMPKPAEKKKGPNILTVCSAVFAPEKFEINRALGKIPHLSGNGYAVDHVVWGAALAASSRDDADRVLRSLQKWCPESLPKTKEILAHRGLLDNRA